jgi:hypothetical protein
MSYGRAWQAEQLRDRAQVSQLRLTYRPVRPGRLCEREQVAIVRPLKIRTADPQ